jgi:hypothetical protein
VVQTAQNIDHLTKVKLSIEAVNAQERSNSPSEPVSYEFVVGIGAHGYSPFEYELMGKEIGDVLTLTLDTEEISPFFEHLNIPLAPIPPNASSVRLNVRIDRITVPDQAEIIRAMADGTACGDHCCGSHS